MKKKFNRSLFSSNQPFKLWPGYKPGTKGPRGIISSYVTKRRDDAATASRIAEGIEAAVDGRMSVSVVDGQNMAYIEYKSDAATSKPRPYIVMYDQGANCFDVISNDTYNLGVIPTIAGLFLFSEQMVKDMPELTERNFHMKDYPNVSAEQMLRICDLFYYRFIDTEFEFRTLDEASFDAQKNRIIQSGTLHHVNVTAAPVGLVLSDTGDTTGSAEIQEDIFTMPLEDFMKKCRNGDFIVEYPWKDWQRKAIKPLSFLDSFVPTEEFRIVFISVYYAIKEKLAAMRDHIPYDIMMETPINVLLMGKPGTGKTKTVEAIMCALGFPKGFINCKETSEEDEYEGMPKVIDGRLQSVTTELARYFGEGGCVDLEEINLPNPGITQGALGQALVNPCILKVDGFRERKRHPLTIIFATMNVGTNGSKPLNEALASRFEAFILEDSSQFDDIIFKSGYPKKFCKTAIRAYKAAVSYLIDNGSEELTRLITVRGTITMARKLSYGFTVPQALKNAFVSQIYAVDPAIATDMESCIGKAI